MFQRDAVLNAVRADAVVESFDLNVFEQARTRPPAVHAHPHSSGSPHDHVADGAAVVGQVIDGNGPRVVLPDLHGEVFNVVSVGFVALPLLEVASAEVGFGSVVVGRGEDNRFRLGGIAVAGCPVLELDDALGAALAVKAKFSPEVAVCLSGFQPVAYQVGAFGKVEGSSFVFKQRPLNRLGVVRCAVAPGAVLGFYVDHGSGGKHFLFGRVGLGKQFGRSAYPAQTTQQPDRGVPQKSYQGSCCRVHSAWFKVMASGKAFGGGLARAPLKQRYYGRGIVNNWGRENPLSGCEPGIESVAFGRFCQNLNREGTR